MTAKKQAILDIKDDLRSMGKSYLPFRVNLNPVMHQLVNDHLTNQGLSIRKTQLVARCFFCKATQTATFNNYSKYYAQV